MAGVEIRSNKVVDAFFVDFSRSFGQNATDQKMYEMEGETFKRFSLHLTPGWPEVNSKFASNAWYQLDQRMHASRQNSKET